MSYTSRYCCFPRASTYGGVVWNGQKRFASASDRSYDGSPVASHCATCWPIPPACVTQTASHTHTPPTFVDSPTIDAASGVKENIPFSERAGSEGRIRPFSGGSIRAASASATSKSDGTNGINEGS